MQSNNLNFKVSNPLELIKDSSNILKTVRITFGSGSASQVIDELEVEIGIENSRTQLNKCASLKIFNPSLERMGFMIPGNLVEIKLGYVATNNVPAFFGYITDSGVSWEGGDLALNVTLTPYIDGVLATATQGEYANVGVHITSECSVQSVDYHNEDIRNYTFDFFNSSSAESSGVSGMAERRSIKGAFMYLISKINDSIPDKFQIELEVNWDEFISMDIYDRVMRSNIGGFTTKKYDEDGNLTNQDIVIPGLDIIEYSLPMTRSKLSIKDIINSFMYDALLVPDGHSTYGIIWWVDGQTIRFPHGQSEYYSANPPDKDRKVDKRLIALGSNAYKINSNMSVKVKPDFANPTVNPNENESEAEVIQTQSNRDSTSKGPDLFDVSLTTVRTLVILAIGMPDVTLGSLIRISNNESILKAVDKMLGSLGDSSQTDFTKRQIANLSQGDPTEELWVVDALEHMFNSTNSFRTRIRVVPAVVAKNTNFRPSNPREQFKFAQEQKMLDLIDRFKLLTQGYSMPTSDDFINKFAEATDDDGKYLVTTEDGDFVIDEDGNLQYSEDPSTSNKEYGTTKWNMYFNTDDASMYNPGNGDWTRILSGGNEVQDRRKYVMRSAHNTSMWAMMYQTPLEAGGQWLAAGIWYPKYKPYEKKRKYLEGGTASNATVKPHYSQVVQRHLMHKIDDKVFLGAQDWGTIGPHHKKTMGCYYTDYMIRSPARSVFLLPTTTIYEDEDDQSFSSHSRFQKDGGTATLIATSVLMESNPLIKRRSSNHPAHTNRPNIKTLFYTMSDRTKNIIDGISGLSQLSDVTKKHPGHASPIRYVWNMSDDSRMYNSSMLYYYRNIDKSTESTGLVDFVYTIPGAEWILDNDKGKAKNDMTRIVMRLGDDSTSNKANHKVVQMLRDSLYTSTLEDPTGDDIYKKPRREKDYFLMRDRQQYKVKDTSDFYTTFVEQRLDRSGTTSSVEIGNYVKTTEPIDYAKDTPSGDGSAPTNGLRQSIKLDATSVTDGTITILNDNSTEVQTLKFDTGTAKEILMTYGTTTSISMKYDRIVIKNTEGGSVTWTMLGGIIDIT